MHDIKKRTTLTLPAAALQQAEALAAARNMTVSAVVSEALEAGLASRARSQRAADVFTRYQKAFGGLTEEELLIVSGVDLEPIVDE